MSDVRTPKMLYDAYTYQEDACTYREMLLTDSEETSNAIRQFRPFSWALWATRLAAVPSTQEQAAQQASTSELLLMCTPSARGLHRYDRVVIVQRGEDDCIGALVEFFRRCLPQIINEKRLFLARVPEDLGEEGVERAIGAARAIE